MDKDIAVLERKARQAGFGKVRTRNGHTKLTGPTGQVVIVPGTPSDHRSVANTKSLLKRAGLGEGQEQDSKRKTEANQRVENASTAVRVLEFLQASPGQVFSPTEIAEALNRQRNVITAALSALKASNPDVSNPERGKWVYTKPADLPVAAEPDPEPEPKPKRPAYGEVTGKILAHFREYPHQPFTAKKLADALGLPQVNVNVSLSNLVSRHEELFRISRGVYAWRPATVPEDVRLRSRLRIIERELADPNTGPAAHNLLMAEKALLEGKLDTLNHRAPAEPVQVPTEPERAVAVEELSVATKAITVMPTALPDDCPSLFEAVTVHPRSGTLLLRDQNGEIWAAVPVRIDIPQIAVVNGGR